VNCKEPSKNQKRGKDLVKKKKHKSSHSGHERTPTNKRKKHLGAPKIKWQSHKRGIKKKHWDAKMPLSVTLRRSSAKKEKTFWGGSQTGRGRSKSGRKKTDNN